jgi:hypothetical protein
MDEVLVQFYPRNGKLLNDIHGLYESPTTDPEQIRTIMRTAKERAAIFAK